MPQRRRAMTLRDGIRKAGITEGCLGCKAALGGAKSRAQDLWRRWNTMTKPAERLIGMKRSGAPDANESASNTEGTREVANQGHDSARARLEPARRCEKQFFIVILKVVFVQPIIAVKCGRFQTHSNDSYEEQDARNTRGNNDNRHREKTCIRRSS